MTRGAHRCFWLRAALLFAAEKRVEAAAAVDEEPGERIDAEVTEAVEEIGERIAVAEQVGKQGDLFLHVDGQIVEAFGLGEVGVLVVSAFH